MYGDIDDNNSTSFFANGFTHTFIINEITRDFHHIRVQMEYGTFYFDWMPNNANSGNKRNQTKREENKQSNKTCTFTHNYYFCKMIRQSISSERMNEYLHVYVCMARNTTKLLALCVACVCVLLLGNGDLRVQFTTHSNRIFFLPFICVWNTHIFLQLLRVSNILLHKCVIIIIVPHPFEWQQKLLHTSSLSHASHSLSLLNSIWNISFAFNFYF